MLLPILPKSGTHSCRGLLSRFAFSVSRLVPRGKEAHTLAAQLAAGPTKAFGAGKRLMHAGWNETLESQIEQELRSIGVMSRIEDAREAIAAFAAKRALHFKGR